MDLTLFRPLLRAMFLSTLFELEMSASVAKEIEF